MENDSDWTQLMNMAEEELDVQPGGGLAGSIPQLILRKPTAPKRSLTTEINDILSESPANALHSAPASSPHQQFQQFLPVSPIQQFPLNPSQQLQPPTSPFQQLQPPTSPFQQIQPPTSPFQQIQTPNSPFQLLSTSPHFPYQQQPSSPFQPLQPNSPFQQYQTFDPHFNQQNAFIDRRISLNMSSLNIMGTPTQPLLLSPLTQLQPPPSPNNITQYNPTNSPYIMQLQTPQIWAINSPMGSPGQALLSTYADSPFVVGGAQQQQHQQGHVDFDNYDFENLVKDELGWNFNASKAATDDIFQEFGLATGGTTTTNSVFDGVDYFGGQSGVGEAALSSSLSNSNTNNITNNRKVRGGGGKKMTGKATPLPGGGKITKGSDIPSPIKIKDPNVLGPDGKPRDVLYQCPFEKCEKTFTRPYNLKSHYRSTHTDERPYECDKCVMTFVRKHDLQRHLKLHQNEKPFKCSNCEKSFARSDALKRHQTPVEGKDSNCTVNVGLLGSGNGAGGGVRKVGNSSLLPLVSAGACNGTVNGNGIVNGFVGGGLDSNFGNNGQDVFENFNFRC